MWPLGHLFDGYCDINTGWSRDACTIYKTRKAYGSFVIFDQALYMYSILFLKHKSW